MRKGTKELAVGAALAAGIGYLAGILTAPKSGKETRKDIGKAAFKTKAEAERRLKQLHSELNDVMNVAKKKLSSLSATAKADLAEVLLRAQAAKEKARDMLSALHEGGAEDKDLRRAITDVTEALDHLRKYLDKDAKKTKS